MTLKELKHIVDQSITTFGNSENNVVMIQMNEPGIPTAPMVGVRHARLGFDWTHGRFIITPEQPVIRKPSKKVKP